MISVIIRSSTTSIVLLYRQKLLVHAKLACTTHKYSKPHGLQAHGTTYIIGATQVEMMYIHTPDGASVIHGAYMYTI